MGGANFKSYTAVHINFPPCFYTFFSYTIAFFLHFSKVLPTVRGFYEPMYSLELASIDLA